MTWGNKLVTHGSSMMNAIINRIFQICLMRKFDDSSVNGRFRVETNELRQVHVHSSLLVVTSNQNASNKKKNRLNIYPKPGMSHYIPCLIWTRKSGLVRYDLNLTLGCHRFYYLAPLPVLDPICLESCSI
jgi:hypothetical protein